jgi:hypothetical protein
MSVKLDQDLRGVGTKFRLFPQPPFLEPFGEPETVWVSPLAGTVGSGPADERMYVVDPIHKDKPYEFPYMPPYDLAVHPAVPPDALGHFDYLDPDSRAFKVAHMYGTIRRVLDIWEGYRSGRIDWHFREEFERMELIPLLDWDNAQSGYGFIEAGHVVTEDGDDVQFSLNFDVLAHELGHSIIFSQVGFPGEGTDTVEFLGFHESASDLIALISVLHFDSVVDHLLQVSRGNLYTLNELNRIGELSETEQIRIASNLSKMSDFLDGWTNVHDVAQPLTGGIFDIFVDVFELLLLERGLISERMWSLAEKVPEEPVDENEIQWLFDQAYQGRHQAFKDALLDARDYMGELFATSWQHLSPNDLTFARVGDALLAADRQLTGGRYQDSIFENIVWREIGSVPLGPEMETSATDPQLHAIRGVTALSIVPGLSYRHRMEVACRGV